MHSVPQLKGMQGYGLRSTIQHISGDGEASVSADVGGGRGIRHQLLASALLMALMKYWRSFSGMLRAFKASSKLSPSFSIMLTASFGKTFAASLGESLIHPLFDTFDKYGMTEIAH